LLVVIAVLASLWSLLFPSFGQAREKTRRATCLWNLKQIGLAVNLYAEDNNGRFPGAAPNAYPYTADGRATMLFDQNYLKDQAVFYCPGNPEIRKQGWGNTAYLMLWSSTTWGAIPFTRSDISAKAPEKWPLVGDLACNDKYPSLINHKAPDGTAAGANWCYLDGHASWCDRPELTGSFGSAGVTYYVPWK